MGLSLEGLVGSVKNVLGGTIGMFGLGAALIFGGAVMSGCGEHEEELVETGTTRDISDFTADPGPEENQIDLSWKIPTEGYNQTVMLRKSTNSFPTKTAEGTLVYEGIEENVVDSNLTDDVLYHYTIFCFSYIDGNLYTSKKTASSVPLDLTPPGDVSNLIATPANNSVLLSWTNPSASDLQKISVVRKLGSAPNDLNDGDLIYEGTEESIVDTNLIEDLAYFYKLFSSDERPNFSSGISVSAIPLDGIAPGNVSNLIVTPGNNSADLSWINPTDADFAGIIVLRKIGSFPSSPSDGTLIYTGTDTSFTDTGLIEDILHFYKVFAQDEIPNFSSGAEASATPLDGIAPANASGFTGIINGNAIDFSWINPSDSDFVSVVLRRKQGSFPTSSTDGTLVYEGSDQSVTDSSLADGDYFYAIFTKDEIPNISSGGTLQKKIDYVYAVGWIGSGSHGWQTGSTPYAGQDYKSFFAPSGVFIDSSGTIYVADKQNHRVTTWSSSNGTALGWFGGGTNNWKTGSAPSTYADDYQSFNNPSGVFVRGNDIYIADFNNHRVSKWFTTAGTHGWIGGASNGWKVSNGIFAGALDYQSFFSASHVFVDSSGNMYVPHHHCISKWDANGNAQGWIGHGFDGWQQSYVPSSGSSAYKNFSGSGGTFVDSNGTIYVADYGNHRICKWDSNGNAIGWIGGGSNGWKTSSGASSGSDYQSFNGPSRVFVDSNGNIYVTEYMNHRISKWDANGNAIGWIGGGSNSWQTGSAPTVHNTDYQSFGFPMDTYVDTSGNIYVADWFNNRISKWKD